MEIMRKGSNEFVIGPLSYYSCDGVSIAQTGVVTPDRYKLTVYEASGSPSIFDPQEIEWYKRADTVGVDAPVKGRSYEIYLNDEEMEALFLSWQMLKNGE